MSAWLPLIAGKPLCEFTPEDYMAHVTAMYGLRVRGGKSGKTTKSPVPGITLNRTKKGGWSLRRAKAKRPFPYILHAEIKALAEHHKTNQSDVWNVCKQKGFIIAVHRLEAERQYAVLKESGAWDPES